MKGSNVLHNLKNKHKSEAPNNVRYVCHELVITQFSNTPYLQLYRTIGLGSTLLHLLSWKTLRFCQHVFELPHPAKIEYHVNIPWLSSQIIVFLESNVVYPESNLWKALLCYILSFQLDIKEFKETKVVIYESYLKYDLIHFDNFDTLKLLHIFFSHYK